MKVYIKSNGTYKQLLYIDLTISLQPTYHFVPCKLCGDLDTNSTSQYQHNISPQQ